MRELAASQRGRESRVEPQRHPRPWGFLLQLEMRREWSREEL